MVKVEERERERVISPKEVLRIIKAMIQGRRIIRTCSPLSCRFLQCYYVCMLCFLFHFKNKKPIFNLYKKTVSIPMSEEFNKLINLNMQVYY